MFYLVISFPFGFFLQTKKKRGRGTRKKKKKKKKMKKKKKRFGVDFSSPVASLLPRQERKQANGFPGNQVCVDGGPKDVHTTDLPTPNGPPCSRKEKTSVNLG